MSFSAAILAGGRATRLGGRDKSRLHIEGAAIIDRQLALLRPLVTDILIVTNEPTRYASLGHEVVADLLPDMGALGGLYTAVRAAPTDRVLVLACDLPFLTAPFLRHLLQRAGDSDADVVIPRTTDGYQPLCACYARTCAEPIRRRLEAGLLKVTDVFADVRVQELGPDEIAPYDVDGRLFMNINTPDDHARALKLG
jgi:molybdopterin-guanine dinucleotide biosynthesis protein A